MRFPTHKSENVGLICTYGTSGGGEYTGPCYDSYIRYVTSDYAGEYYTSLVEYDKATGIYDHVTIEFVENPSVLPFSSITHISITKKDGSDISCGVIAVNLKASEVPPDHFNLTGCRIEPPTININMTTNPTANPKVMCKYEGVLYGGGYRIPNKRTTVWTDCYSAFTKAYRIRKDVDDTKFTVSMNEVNSIYDTITVTGKSESTGHITLSFVNKQNDIVSCGADVNVKGTDLNDLSMVSCALLPKHLSIDVGKQGALNLMCSYKVKGTNRIIVAPCYKSSDVVGATVDVNPDPFATIDTELVYDKDAKVYKGVRVDAKFPSFSYLSVYFQKSDGSQISCESNVTVNVPSNNTNTTTTGGNGHGGKTDNGNPTGFWCSIVGPEETYTGSTSTYSVNCYVGGYPVDCTGGIPNMQAVAWTKPNNQEVYGRSQNVVFGTKPGTAKLSAVWNTLGGSVSCGEITIHVKVPTCFKFM